MGALGIILEVPLSGIPAGSRGALPGRNLQQNLWLGIQTLEQVPEGPWKLGQRDRGQAA